jgi:predicted RNase H-like HicB family nuclease
MKQYQFPIIIEQDKDGFFAICPEFQGCYSQGKTYEDALENIKDAIKLHIEDHLTDREGMEEKRSVSFTTVAVAV